VPFSCPREVQRREGANVKYIRGNVLEKENEVTYNEVVTFWEDKILTSSEVVRFLLRFAKYAVFPPNLQNCLSPSPSGARENS